MNPFDIHSLFGYSTVAAITSQTGTTLILTVQAGEGTKFAIGQQVMDWPVNAQPVLANAMVGRVTGISGDVLTIDVSSGSREGSSTRTALVGDQISNVITPKIYTDIENVLLTGWVPITDTLVYASASSVTISGVDRTSMYTKGTRVKFTNNGITYYGTVGSSVFSTNTTVSFIPNSDFTIANLAITSPYYSYQASPKGYPAWFTFSPAATGFTGTITYDITKFSVVGSVVTIQASISGTSNTTAMQISLPISRKSGPGTVGYSCLVANNGAFFAAAALIGFVDDSTIVFSTAPNFAGGANTNNFTASGQKGAQLNFSYEF